MHHPWNMHSLLIQFNMTGLEVPLQEPWEILAVVRYGSSSPESIIASLLLGFIPWIPKSPVFNPLNNSHADCDSHAWRVYHQLPRSIRSCHDFICLLSYSWPLIDQGLAFNLSCSRSWKTMSIHSIGSYQQTSDSHSLYDLFHLYLLVPISKLSSQSSYLHTLLSSQSSPLYLCLFPPREILHPFFCPSESPNHCNCNDTFHCLSHFL